MEKYGCHNCAAVSKETTMGNEEDGTNGLKHGSKIDSQSH